ncbi:MAG: TolB family protein [Gaiellales bacterium]
MQRRRIAILVSVVTALLALASTAGATIAYQASSGSRLMIASDQAGRPTRLGATGTAPLISPDGTRVAYLGGTTARPQLRIRTIATGVDVVAAATPGTSIGQGIEWAPDSSHLLMPTESATAKGYITGAGLDIVDAATGAVTVVLAPKGHDLGGFSWAPTADRLVVASQRYGGAYGDCTMRIIGLDGGTITSLGTGANPLWGPQKIAFQRYANVRWHGMTVQHAQLWTIDANGPGVPRQLTHYGSVGLIYGPFATLWSPDGGTLYGGIGGEDVSMPGRFSATTGRYTRLRDGSGTALDDAAPIAVSDDGRTLLLDVGEMSGAPVYKTMPAGDGVLRVFLKHAYNLTVQPSWQP